MLLLLLSRFSRVRLCATPERAAHQAPLSLGFSRQEHWVCVCGGVIICHTVYDQPHLSLRVFLEGTFVAVTFSIYNIMLYLQYHFKALEKNFLQRKFMETSYVVLIICP